MKSLFLSLVQLISRWSLKRVQCLGALLGLSVYYLSSRYRHLLNQNLEQSCGKQGFDLRREAARQAGKTMLELIRIWRRPLTDVVTEIREVQGEEHLDEAVRQGKGIIFLTPHLGCFEITAQYLSTRFPITVLYRAPKQKMLDNLMRQGRKREQLQLAPADRSGVRALIKALRQNQAIGLLPDQAPGAGEGIWLPFFDRPAYTMTLAARLTETGAPVLLIVGERLPQGQGYRLRIESPRYAIEGGLEDRALRINQNMEALIRDLPAQYLWGYNRYKCPRGAEAPLVN